MGVDGVYYDPIRRMCMPTNECSPDDFSSTEIPEASAASQPTNSVPGGGRAQQGWHAATTLAVRRQEPSFSGFMEYLVSDDSNASTGEAFWKAAGRFSFGGLAGVALVLGAEAIAAVAAASIKVKLGFEVAGAVAVAACAKSEFPGRQTQLDLHITQTPPNPVPIPYGAEIVPVEFNVTVTTAIGAVEAAEVAIVAPYELATTWTPVDAVTGGRTFRVEFPAAEVKGSSIQLQMYARRGDDDHLTPVHTSWDVSFASVGIPRYSATLEAPNTTTVGQSEIIQLTVRPLTGEATERLSEISPTVIVWDTPMAVYSETSPNAPLARETIRDREGEGLAFALSHTFQEPGVITINAHAEIDNIVVLTAQDTIQVDDKVTPPNPDAGTDGPVVHDGGSPADAMTEESEDGGTPDGPLDGGTPEDGTSPATDGGIPGDSGLPDAGGMEPQDVLFPTTTHNAPMGWQPEPVMVTLTPTDDLSGVAFTRYCVDQANACVPETVGTSVMVEAEGENYVRFYSQDVAGNVEPVQSVLVRIDNTPPITTDNAPVGTAIPPITISLAATDSLSGVGTTQYCVDQIDACLPETLGTSIAFNAEGNYFLRYHSTDLAGNVEGDSSTAVSILDTLHNAHCELGLYTLCTDMDDYDTAHWTKADGWTNGPPFGNGWRAENVTFRDGVMVIELNDSGCPAACSGMPYASGEYRSNALYGPGLLEARIRVPQQSGIVAGSLFFYRAVPWHETDIEILGQDTTAMQTNYFTDGVGGHETLVDLGFDAAGDYHTYGIEWRADAINWYVDGSLVHTEDGSGGALPSMPGCIKMNMWPGVGVEDWLGGFTYSGPVQTFYDWVRYTAE